MEAILGFVGGKVGGVLAMLSIAALFPIAKKAIVAAVGKMASKHLGKLLDPNTDDPKEKALIRDAVLALVKLAEYKIPDGGSEKFKAVAATLVRMLPALKKHEDRIADLIEEAVAKMDEELKKAGG